MGDRGSVHIKDESVWLYTHYGARELTETVRKALSHTKRWNDPEYLARIVFDEMTRDAFCPYTGYGISGRGPHGDEWRVITVDVENKVVRVEDNGVVKIETSFDKFIAGTDKCQSTQK